MEFECGNCKKAVADGEVVYSEVLDYNICELCAFRLVRELKRELNKRP